MNDDHCARAGHVLRACESGTWSEELRAHADTCASCEEVRVVALALQRMVAEEDTAPVPDASDLWWMARQHADREARQRAMRPLDTLERVEPLLAFSAVVAFLVLRGDALMASLTTWVAGEAGTQALHLFMPAAVLPLVLVGVGLGALVLVAGLTAMVVSE